MDIWVWYGTAAAVIWGVYVPLLRVATRRLHPSVAFSWMTLGILVTLAATYLLQSDSASLLGPGLVYALMAGLLWGGGMACVMGALSLPPTTVSRLAPLYNVNTLVPLILGILVLGEVPEPSSIAIVSIGALLVIAGGYLVTREPSATHQDEPCPPTSSTAYGRIPTIMGIAKWAWCTVRKIIALPKWAWYGVGAIIMWGLYIVCLKVAVSPAYESIEPRAAFLMMVLGITIVSVITLLFTREGIRHYRGRDDLEISLWPFTRHKIIRLDNTRAGLLSLIAGILWGTAMVLVIQALSDFRAPVARLAPLYNTNTLIAAGLGLLCLKEAHEWNRREIAYVVLGAICVAMGGTLVSL